jgi:hypothetical protein
LFCIETARILYCLGFCFSKELLRSSEFKGRRKQAEHCNKPELHKRLTDIPLYSSLHREELEAPGVHPVLPHDGVGLDALKKTGRFLGARIEAVVPDKSQLLLPLSLFCC